MRRSSFVLGTALLGIAAAPYPQPPASASCAAPTLAVPVDEVLTRGATVSVDGDGFVDGCQDLGSCSVGCGAECDYGPSPEPYQDVELRLVQHGQTWRLDTADAGSAVDGRLGQVAWTFRVPRDVEPGRARLVAAYALPVPVRVH